MKEAVVDLLARVDEVLQTLLELLRVHIAGRALHLGSPLAQVTQITSLVAGEVRTLGGGVSRVSGLASDGLAFVKVGLVGARRNGSPLLLDLIQFQHLVVGRSGQVVILLVGQILHVHHSGTIATHVVVARVQTVGLGQGSELLH